TVTEAIGEGFGSLRGLEGERHRHWPEDLFTGDDMGGLDTVEDGRLDEIAKVEMLRTPATQAQASPFASSLFDIAGDPLILLGRDHGAEITVSQTRPDGQSA